MGFEDLVLMLGLDLGKVFAVNGLTSWVKDELGDRGLAPALSRFYIAIPFLCAAALCFPAELDLLATLKCGALYGGAAVILKNFHRTAWEGR